MEELGRAEVQPCWLERQVLLDFKLALADNRLDVAEHLFQALKALQSDCLPGSSLTGANLSIPHPYRT